MSAPIPPDGPDGPLLARCYDFTTVDALLRAWDAKEVELDDDGAAAAISRYWDAMDAIARTPASTEVMHPQHDGFFRTRVSRFDAALPPGAGLR